MKVAFKFLLIGCVAALSPACGDKSDGGGDGDDKPQVSDPQGPQNPDNPPQSGDQQVKPGAPEAGKNPQVLEAATLDALIQQTVPDFKAKQQKGTDLYDRLREFTEQLNKQEYGIFKNPALVGQSSTDDDPNLVDGAPCKAIYHGLFALDFDLSVLDISQAATKVRYGVDETDSPDTKRSLIKDRPVYSSVSFKEVNKYSFSEATSHGEFHVGADGEWVVLASSKLSQKDDRKEWGGDRLDRCVFAFNKKTGMYKRACSSAYWSEQKMYRKGIQSAEQFKAGAYSYSVTDSASFNGYDRKGTRIHKQTGPMSASFEHDYRDTYTSSDGGVFFGGLFPPYSYAKGDIQFGKTEGSSTVNQCTVVRVTTEAG